MKRFITGILLASAVFTSNCSKKPETESAPADGNFTVSTLRKKIVTFTNVDAGMVGIPKKNIPKMYEIGKDGSPVYLTSDIADTFIPGKSVTIANNSGPCIRFKVPRIDAKDYLVLRAEIKFPKESVIGGIKRSSLGYDYRFDSWHSGKMEYIWFIFDENTPGAKIAGEWEMKISSGERAIVSAYFDVK